MEIAAEQDEASIMDEGKAAHDEATVNSVRGQAITIGHSLGLLLSPNDEKVALGLFPKVNPFPFFYPSTPSHLDLISVRWLVWLVESMTPRHFKRSLKNSLMPRSILTLDRNGLLHDVCLLDGTLI